MQQNICSDENEMIVCMGYMYSPWRRFCHQELPHHLSSAVLLCGLAFSLGSQFLPSSLPLWSQLHSACPAIWPTKRRLLSNGDLFNRPIIFYFLDIKRPVKFKIVFLGTNTAIHRSNKILTMNMWEREYNKCDMILLSWMSKLELSYLKALSPLSCITTNYQD